MKALVLEQINQLPVLQNVTKPTSNARHLVVKLHAAALNHRDIWIMKGKYGGIQLPIIPGSDGVCSLNGEKYLINPGLNWGGDQRYQSQDFQILGMPQNGTFAEYVAVPKENLHYQPDHLSAAQAAALPLAGVTAYRALIVKGQPKRNENILIHGVGGGVASMALLFALATESNVYVSSSSQEKIDKAIALGAVAGVNYTSTNWVEELREISGGMDVIIDSAGGEGFNKLLDLCRPAARISIFGGTKGKISKISPQVLFWKQISIFGTTMGSNKDFEDMVDYVSLHDIIPIVDSVFRLDQADLAYKRMMDGQQFGKIVFDIP